MAVSLCATTLAAHQATPSRRGRVLASAGGHHQAAAKPTPPPAASIAASASRRTALAALVASIAAVKAAPSLASDTLELVQHSDAEWRQLLSPEAYSVLRQAQTERRYSSPLVDEKRVGTFVCGGCGLPLFPSEAKYESGTGWPSFSDALPKAVKLEADYSIPFMPRTEVLCQRCQGHLGHVFKDGPRPTGLRYCMNGAALAFVHKQA